MQKRKCLIILLLVMVAVSGCGTGRSGDTDSSNIGIKKATQVSEGLEKYIGGSIEELSSFLNEKPELSEEVYSDEGYLEKVKFHV